MTDRANDNQAYVEESKLCARGVQELASRLLDDGYDSHAVCSGFLGVCIQMLVAHDGADATAVWLREVADGLEATPERQLHS